MAHGLVARGRTPDFPADGSPVSVLVGSTGVERQQAREDRMTIEAQEKQRREIYEIAEAIAPGWERWRARIEEITTPVAASPTSVSPRTPASGPSPVHESRKKIAKTGSVIVSRTSM